MPAFKRTGFGSLQETETDAYSTATDLFENELVENSIVQRKNCIWSEWRLTVIAATVRIALVDILDLSEVDMPAGGFLCPAVGWG